MKKKKYIVLILLLITVFSVGLLSSCGNAAKELTTETQSLLPDDNPDDDGGETTPALPPPDLSGKWNMFRGNDGKNQGYINDASFNGPAGTPGINTVSLSNLSKATPVIDRNGKIYVGDSGGNLYRIDPSDGYSKTVFKSGLGMIQTAPAIDRNGNIYVGTSTGVYAFKEDGTQKWHFAPTGMSFSSSAPMVHFENEGREIYIYIGSTNSSDDGSLYAIKDLGDSYELRYEFTQCAAVQSTVALDISGGNVYVGDLNGDVYKVSLSDKTSFSKIYDGTTAEKVKTPLLFYDGKIVYGAFNKRLYVVSSSGGAFVWRSQELINIIASAPALKDGIIYTSATKIGSGSFVYAFDFSNTGDDIAPKWTYDTGINAFQTAFTTTLSSIFIDQSGKLYIGLRNRVQAVKVKDDQTGLEKVWEIIVAANINDAPNFDGSPIVYNSTVYITSDKNSFYYLKQ